MRRDSSWLWIAFGALLLFGGVMAGREIISKIRGIRNHNPGNIERVPGTVWRGMATDQSADPRFIVFTAPQWGIRAMARILKNYATQGYRSVAQILTRYAPSIENDTASYIASVSQRLGVDPRAPLALNDATLAALVKALIQHENGVQPYSDDIIQLGINLERAA